MPQGKGTYGSKVGRPPKKKKIDPVKKKKAKGYMKDVAAIAKGGKRKVVKNKANTKRKPSAQLTRDQFLAKQAKNKKKGPKPKGGGEVLTSGSAKSVAALRKAALLKAKKKGVKKPMKPAVKAKRGSSSTKRKSLKY